MKRIAIFFYVTFCFTTTILAQKSNLITKIPFQLEGNHLFIKVKVNDSDNLHFVFDTGAGVTSINSTTAKRLELIGSKTTTSKGASGKIELKVVKNNELVIRDLRLKKIDLYSAPLLHLEKVLGTDIDGIIGYDIFKKYVVKINYDTSEIELYASRGYKYVGKGGLVKIDLGKVPTAKAKIDIGNGNYLDGEFILDNGAGLAMGFCTPYAQRHQLKKSIGKTYSVKSRGYSSNTTIAEVGRLKELKLQKFQFSNIPVRIYNTKSGVLAHEGIAGIIGNEILKRFNIIFDYKRKESYWEPNNMYNNVPYDVSYSGLKLSLDETKTKVLIDNIISDSPSALSKMKIGDEIIEINGVKAKDSSLTTLRKLLRQENTKVTIKCMRNDTLIEVAIQLTAII
ncbi:aspartyl protease family protein [Aquimarina mytili]|uniref:Aspartyl protease family protein n=1 Tax=Aquimarina mytili TaxID=874423 RepID=A0A937DAN4_9FLAO|nr:aspartyl protease family protein [Aquimarina mytili]MBL0683728.1 aspartyl protease family protein [Aquimarina mytili]